MKTFLDNFERFWRLSDWLQKIIFLTGFGGLVFWLIMLLLSIVDMIK